MQPQNLTLQMTNLKIAKIDEKSAVSRWKRNSVTDLFQ